ncbi:MULTISPECIES: nicotinate phosphoribosyltransferase [Sphingomonas]|uniref:nicotinate phosphoribosyltransferase n=1 Tax=Sphingomonas TaxID=13687 RepID=UPI002867F288|nr:nicotinate phosphoribosyltransferase [Sphingomonas sp. CGMCC 1.13658]
MSGRPIVETLLDTDFYKWLMLQLIRRLHPDVRTEWALINRTRSVRLAEQIDIGELREQLDHVRTLPLAPAERAWLGRLCFDDMCPILEPGFLDWAERLRLPAYELAVRDCQVDLRFDGPWAETTLWEIAALAIVNELRSRAALRGVDARSLYAGARERLRAKASRLAAIPDLMLSDFGTRRRHGRDWQEDCILTLRDALGSRLVGTSNALFAMRHGLEPIGTNGHELPMTLAALAPDDDALARSPYLVLEEWDQLYGGRLLVALPDTFGTRAFLRDAPAWVADWTGFRPDSAPPVEAGEEIIAWWRRHGVDPAGKRLIFADALDVDAIERLHGHFAARVRTSFGWGTDLTNDTGSADPRLMPLSLVCKVTAANGRPAVKLSDNPAKALGPPAEVARYLRVFGSEGMIERSLRY